MKNVSNTIEFFLAQHGVSFSAQSSIERKQVEERWLQLYARQVKNSTGSWVYGGFKWHGFSCKFESALEGEQALQAYLSQWSAPYFIFDENSVWSYVCTSEKYLDFTGLHTDIYVAHHNMKWTMAFTHEQPHDGPFFAIETRNL